MVGSDVDVGSMSLTIGRNLVVTCFADFRRLGAFAVFLGIVLFALLGLAPASASAQASDGADCPVGTAGIPGVNPSGPDARFHLVDGSQQAANLPTDDDDVWQAAVQLNSGASTLYLEGREFAPDDRYKTCLTYVAVNANDGEIVTFVQRDQPGLHTMLLGPGVWTIDFVIEEHLLQVPDGPGPTTLVVFKSFPTNQARVTIQAPVGLPGGSEPGFVSGGDEAVSWDADTGTWSIRNADGSVDTARWGTAGDVPLVGDVDGDGVADRVVWRASNGRWYGQNKAGETILNKGWGTRGDVPLLGDVDGDGHDDMIIWRPSNGRWYVKSSANYTTLMNVAWGRGSLGDIPLIGDLDGDGRDDIIIWRPKTGSNNNGRFYAKNFDGTTIFNRSWGAGRLGDIPLIGDVDGDGADEVVIFRPSSARWYPKSIDNSRPVQSIRHGAAGGNDVPMMFDADGDGDDDAVVVRNYNGKTYWYGRDSANQQLPFYGVQLGAEGDTTLAGNYS